MMRPHMVLAALGLAAAGASFTLAAQTTDQAATAPAPPPVAPDWAAPTTEYRVAVEGGNVWVGIHGRIGEGAAPAILIHGGPGGTHVKLAGLTSLADARAVILYDQLDSGLSDRPENPANWHPERFLAELEAIRAALGIARWHVIGHSWGSALALEYAARYPEHTASAVLSGTFLSTADWIAGTRRLIDDLPAPVAATIIDCEGPTPPGPEVCDPATAAFYAAHNGRPDRPDPSPAAVAYGQRYGGMGFNAKVYNAMWGPTEFRASGSLANYDVTPLLAQVDGSRVLFVVGQYDEALIDTVQDYAARTRGSELAVVPGGSHAYVTERPELAKALLRDWMSRIDARESAGK